MKKIREIYERYDRKIGFASIFFGFLFDSLTLIRIDLAVNHLLMLAYFIIAGVGIVLINIREEGRAKFLEGELYAWLFISMQFSFGGLFGRFFLYYFHSGILSESFIFLGILGALLIGNEFAKKHYARLMLQISFFFLSLYLFFIYFVPIIVGRLGNSIFIASGISALVVMYFYIKLLLKLSPARTRIHVPMIVQGIATIFVIMNVLYFTNSIPPIPLSLREIGIYHSVSRTTTGYKALVEEAKEEGFLKKEVLSVASGESLSVYSSVFAPTDFGTQIVHNWQRFDDEIEEWVSVSRVPFTIYGGQDSGYRGYTIKSNVTQGRWRVYVETSGGQVIGRIPFTVISVKKTPPLETIQL